MFLRGAWNTDRDAHYKVHVSDSLIAKSFMVCRFSTMSKFIIFKQIIVFVLLHKSEDSNKALNVTLRGANVRNITNNFSVNSIPIVG